MPSFTPLKPGDPERLGDYDLLGRLGEGGQGVVYLAKDSDGTEVAIKWLRPDLSGDEVSIGRFLREVQVAEQVAPFCTAALLGSGVSLERPYIVSEFIEGPSLQKVVHEEGPRTGSSLHRLAIGTATALAAIHQAGIVHRDFKPANVILAADGPRVIDFGIARALNANSTLSNMPVGTPSYMPPEQIMGHPVGAAADLFSWGSAMVFASSGRAPFGSDTMPAVINRVLNSEPDLGALDGPLREVVSACLTKDPAQRPSAEQVILRLLQHPVAASGILREAAAAAAAPPAGMPSVGSPAMGPVSLGTSIPAPIQGPWPMQAGPPSAPVQQHVAPPPPTPVAPPAPAVRKKRRTGLFVGAAVAFVVVLAVGLAVIFVPWKTMLGKTVATASPTASPAPARTAAAIPTTGLKAVPLPGGAVTVFEHPSDPLSLTSYEIFDKSSAEWVDYARTKQGGGFAKFNGNWETMMSPDGRYLVGRGRNYTTDGLDSIVITDRKSGEETTIKTVKKPLISSVRGWSKDSGRLLLNVEKPSGDGWVSSGFVIVDAATKEAKVVNVADDTVRTSLFGWDGADQGLVNVFGKNEGLRFFGLNGKATRDIPNVGKLPSGTRHIFSPTGTRFFTNCPGGEGGDHCVWDVASGDRMKKFSSTCDQVLGWYDEDHLYCHTSNPGGNDEIQVIGLDGKQVRKLAEMPHKFEFSPIFTLNPPKGS